MPTRPSTRTNIADIPGAGARRLLLAGRITAAEGAVLLLADDTGTVRLTLTGASARAGDMVQVEVDPGEMTACALQVLTPYRGHAPFPSPGGEHYRLRRTLPGGADRATLIRRRARCLGAIRAFFADRGYTEVQTPHRVRLPGLEPHLVAERAGGGFLITSPEYHMKRLLAGGMERIYFLGPCWRGDEHGPQHLGELTLLEWYRAYSSLDDMMQETEQLLEAAALELCGGSCVEYQGRSLDLGRPFERLTVAGAFARFAGVEVKGVTGTAELRRRAEAAGLGPFLDSDGFDAIASRILVERVEPRLVGPRPVFLHDFPAPLAALARLKPDDPAVAERFELYAGGLELANAFGELTDPVEQRARLETDQRSRAAAGAPVHPIDERFLAALQEGIPPSAGIALGVDRLVMLLCDVPDIRQVVSFAPDEV